MDILRITTLGDRANGFAKFFPNHAHTAVAADQVLFGMERDRALADDRLVIAWEALVALLIELRPRSAAVKLGVAQRFENLAFAQFECPETPRMRVVDRKHPTDVVRETIFEGRSERNRSD